ncbi:MAG: 3'-5' exonuclease [Desulfobacterales bacterium]
MAKMIPDNVEQFTTEGERHVYNFFKKVAVPDDKYSIWYAPDIQNREPDFVLFCNKIGLIVFEVKDWDLNQFEKVDQNSCTLWFGSKKETRKNPLQQARDYIHVLMEKIIQDGRLVSKDPKFYNKPAIPMDYGVIFPNIPKYDFFEIGLNQVINADKIFFWDDLHPQSDVCSDKSGQCFYDMLQTKFDPLFSFSLNPLELNHLKQLIFPVIRIDLPQRSTENDYVNQIRHLKVLDENQESLARKIDGGHRIITGPSGSGKTLILVHKAAFLLKYNPDIHRILFVCYNITLVHYIKRLLSAKSVPLGKYGVDVVHIYQLCSEILNEKFVFENETSDFYELIIEETKANLKNYHQKYDAILVDEGQDVTEDMFRIITGLLSPKTNNLTIAIDENQNIYEHKHAWKDVGVQARGRVHKITYVYRSTKQLIDFSSRFMEKTADASDNQLDLFPNFGILTGPSPEIIKFDSFDEILHFVVKQIGTIREEKFPLSEIAILYSKKKPEKGSNMILPEFIGKHLDMNGIMHRWASKDYQNKKAYDITTNSITISTIHSAKGFDYSSVFLLGMDSLKPGRWTEAQIRRIAYVAITRARHKLFIPYIEETDLIKQLKKCLIN